MNVTFHVGLLERILNSGSGGMGDRKTVPLFQKATEKGNFHVTCQIPQVSKMTQGILVCQPCFETAPFGRCRGGLFAATPPQQRTRQPPCLPTAVGKLMAVDCRRHGHWPLSISNFCPLFFLSSLHECDMTPGHGYGIMVALSTQTEAFYADCSADRRASAFL